MFVISYVEKRLTSSSFLYFYLLYNLLLQIISKLTFALGPNINFLTGRSIPDYVMGRHFDDVLIATFQSCYGIGIILWHQFRLWPCLAHDAIRYSIALQWSTTIIGRIPADTYAIGWSILDNDLWWGWWFHSNHLVLYFITAKKIVCRTCVISGQTTLNSWVSSNGQSNGNENEDEGKTSSATDQHGDIEY